MFRRIFSTLHKNVQLVCSVRLCSILNNIQYVVSNRITVSGAAPKVKQGIAMQQSFLYRAAGFLNYGNFHTKYPHRV